MEEEEGGGGGEEAEEEKSNHTLAVQLLSRAKCPPLICDHRATASARKEEESGNVLFFCAVIWKFIFRSCVRLV